MVTSSPQEAQQHLQNQPHRLKDKELVGKILSNENILKISFLKIYHLIILTPRIRDSYYCVTEKTG